MMEALLLENQILKNKLYYFQYFSENNITYKTYSDLCDRYDSLNTILSIFNELYPDFNINQNTFNIDFNDNQILKYNNIYIKNDGSITKISDDVDIYI